MKGRTTSLALLIGMLGIALPATIRAAESHTITAVVESGSGKVKPGSSTVATGRSETITAKGGAGWHVATITLDGTTVVYDKDDAIVASEIKRTGRAVKYVLRDVTADHTVAVTFEQNRTYALTLAVEGDGTVRVGGATCTQGAGACVLAATEDRKVKLRAKPTRGQLFAGLSGGASGIRKQNALVMTGDRAVTARFELRSTPAAALKVADKVSVVDAKDDAGGASLRAGRAAVPPDSDYERDETFTFVEERSVEAFDTINEILCMAAQTRYEALLNVGPYKALVDRTQCETERDDAASADGADAQSSGASRPDYMQWTVDSSRRDNGSPHVVEVWVREEPEHPDEPAKLIFAKLVITQSASTDNPYGIFELNFEGHPLEVSGAARTGAARSGEAEPLFKGYMRTRRDATGDVLLQFISADGGSGPEQFMERATLNRNDTGGRGTTSVERRSEEGSGEATYDIAFSDTHFLRHDGVEALCLDRNQFDETAWRYGLYDAATGSRIAPRSGFPVKVTQNGQTYYGWIGYWGMWFPDHVVLHSGDTVYRLGPGDEDGVAAQVFIAPGKLRRHTRRDTTLAEIANIPLDWRDETQQASYRVIWTGAALTKIARFDEPTGTWAELLPPQPLALTGLRYDTLFLWSQALGGNVRVKLDCTSNEPSGPGEPLTFDCSAAADAAVALYTETVVYPSDSVPQALACMAQCPNGADNGSSNPYFDDSGLQFQSVPPASASSIAYAFDDDAMVLMHGATPIVQTAANPAHPWGIHSGALFEPTPANLARLACEWDISGNSTCGWQAWEKLDEYYTWESGPNDWNMLTALRNGAGELERFEPPLAVRYVHAQSDPAAPDHKYDGTTLYLEYGGFGNLHGIPGKCVDRATGDDTSCGPGTRWIPELTIPDGSAIEGESATYLSKALEKEQRMRSVDPSSCSALRLVSYALPGIDDWRAPSIGAEPAVAGPPAVVGGVLQE